jgi:Xaa-Pro aminopeptidase
MRRSLFTTVTLVAALSAPTSASGQERPFGTLREQAALRQSWLQRRMDSVLPALMRKHGVELWVVPMREYNEDPVFSSIVAPTTFAARRRTIYLFHDRCASRTTQQATASAASCKVDRVALGGTSQGGVYEAVRATKPVGAPAAGSGTTVRTAELWGDEQWQVLKAALEERQPKSIAINVSRTYAFADGLSAGERDGMQEALGPEWTRRMRPAEGLAVDLIASRLPEEEATFRRMNELAWQIIQTAFSNRVITPGTTTTADVVWWMRQRVNDLGLGSWFQPSVEVQRRGVTAAQLGDSPVIQRGDVLHCDFGLVALGLNTDTQHMGYVLRPGETAPPAGLLAALRNSNRLQDIVMSEIRPGRAGNEVLSASLARMRADGITGTVYTHPIGVHGHGSGPTIGLWDYQDGVPGRGDGRVIPGMWFSIELEATSPVPEWGGQRVRSAQEEDMILDAAGKGRWAFQRQTEFHLVR